MKYLHSTKKSLVALVFIYYFMLPLAGSMHADSHEDTDISFRWAFVGIVGTENDQRLVSIKRSAVLTTGDRVKMFIEPQKCYVYLIYRSMADEIELLFPYSPQQFGKESNNASKYFIPMGDEWFEMDESTGIETFYLIASPSRLSKMEALFAKHERSEKTEREMLAKEILDVIRNLKKTYRRIVANAERPMSIGGSLRGFTRNKKISPSDIDLIAEQISANNFYSRTFTIDHR